MLVCLFFFLAVPKSSLNSEAQGIVISSFSPPPFPSLPFTDLKLPALSSLTNTLLMVSFAPAWQTYVTITLEYCIDVLWNDL